jgi:hypothetical protein
MILLKENTERIVETKKALGFKLKEFQELIWIPKSQCKYFPNFNKATKFEISDWVWDKKVGELFGGE